MSLGDLAALVAGRPSEELAMRVLPDWDDSPVRLPPDWLPSAGPATSPAGSTP